MPVAPHGHMRATVNRQPLRQAQKVRRGRREGTHFRRHFAIGYKAQAGHHRLFVNVKATTGRCSSSISPFRVASPARGPVYKAEEGPWRPSEVLQEPRVQLSCGLDRAKETSTSVPTTQAQGWQRFHALWVGPRPGGELSCKSKIDHRLVSFGMKINLFRFAIRAYNAAS
jgi:hypothetical protein